MDLIHLMTVFIAVGEEESLAAAARRLDLSPAAVTRAVSALEERLALTLLQRLSHDVRLTEAGRRQLSLSKSIMAALAAADQAVSGINSEHKGRLSVTAPVVFGKVFVLPCIASYMEQFPELEVAACFVDRVVNLVDEGQDVAVRIGPLPDSGLKSVTVGKLRRILCASPAYLARHGVPQRPADLRHHMLISRNGRAPVIDTLPPASDRLDAARPRLTVACSESAIEAAVAGLGIARVMLYQAAPRLASGSLSMVLAEHEEDALPVQVLHRQGRLGASKVRHFIDLLVARLRAEHTLH